MFQRTNLPLGKNKLKLCKQSTNLNARFVKAFNKLQAHVLVVGLCIHCSQAWSNIFLRCFIILQFCIICSWLSNFLLLLFLFSFCSGFKKAERSVILRRADRQIQIVGKNGDHQLDHTNLSFFIHFDRDYYGTGKWRPVKLDSSTKVGRGW